VSGPTTNALGATPPPVTIAFYTTGDTRQATGNSMSVSDAFKKRATLLASSPSYVFGVATASDATNTIRALPANLPIAKVYFVGHGNADVFFFDGAPDGTDNFKTVNSDGVLLNPGAVHSPMNPDSPDGTASKGLIDQLAAHLSLSTSPVEIDFLCCNSGSTLVGTVAQALSGHKINGSVGGYNNDYRTNFVGSKPKEPPPATWWTGPGWYDIIQTDDQQKKMLKRATNNAIPSFDTSSNIPP